MKKLPLLLFLLLTLSATAQENKRTQRFKAGIVAGMDFSQIDGDQIIGFNKPGFHGGIRGSIILAPRWEIGMEMLFVQKGSSSTFSFKPDNQLLFYSLNYVEVPVMVMFSDWQVQFSAGLAFGRALSVDVTHDDGAGPISDQPVIDKYRRNDYSVVLGASYFFDKAKHWGANVVWENSFLSTLKDTELGFRRNRLLTVRGVYMF